MIFAWILFIALIFLLLFVDLGVFRKQDKVLTLKEAVYWSAGWIFIAMLFNVFIYFAYQYNWFNLAGEGSSLTHGHDAVLKYFTGYIIEKSLSLDNIFVMAMIFEYFDVNYVYQHRVLFFGILGAIIMRAIMIISGAILINKFEWLLFVLGGLLILSAVRLLRKKEKNFEPDKNLFVKFIKKFFRVSNSYDGHKFITTVNGKKVFTPLFIVLIIIESMDVLFAVDSVPAVLAISTDPFIVFTSNIFAILGLRSLYFVVSALMKKFVYLKISLIFILAFVGLKMILAHIIIIPTAYSLLIIVLIMNIGILASIRERANREL